ncbi:hypothetical protein JTE90_019039 [Oedothorax gibbosus]|uniref:Uncharacterized protein n=1 Tax=Oedothorax gibbosus TaxID=931172 RepID=A0AAV6V0M0_9ARAC|nr:hypothetical protein JTE90_019039 [Oedothorax gibbosus]
MRRVYTNKHSGCVPELHIHSKPNYLQSYKMADQPTTENPLSTVTQNHPTHTQSRGGRSPTTSCVPIGHLGFPAAAFKEDIQATTTQKKAQKERKKGISPWEDGNGKADTAGSPWCNRKPLAPPPPFVYRLASGSEEP